MGLVLVKDGIHFRPRLDEWITPPCDVPPFRRGTNDRIVLVLLPGLASIVGDSDALRLRALLVWKSPVRGKLRDRRVEGKEGAVFSASKVDSLSTSRKDAEAVVGANFASDKRFSIVTFPAASIRPGDEILRGRVTILISASLLMGLE